MLILSSLTALRTNLIALALFSESSKISLPAMIPITSASPSLKFLTTPFISIASEITIPLKPSSSFNSPVTIGFDNVDGIFGVLSSDGIFICAIITPAAPPLISSLKG
ncbi:hypothetical protein D3C80_1878490 [compost metagenome]